MPLESLLESFLQDKRLRNLYECDHKRQYIHLAVLTKRGKIMASATNRNGSRSSGSGYSERSIHAERNVVKALGNIQELRGCDMYIMRMPRLGPQSWKVDFRSSEPCDECKVFLQKCRREYGLKNVYFTGRSDYPPPPTPPYRRRGQSLRAKQSPPTSDASPAPPLLESPAPPPSPGAEQLRTTPESAEYLEGTSEDQKQVGGSCRECQLGGH